MFLLSALLMRFHFLGVPRPNFLFTISHPHAQNVPAVLEARAHRMSRIKIQASWLWNRMDSTVSFYNFFGVYYRELGSHIDRELINGRIHLVQRLFFLRSRHPFQHFGVAWHLSFI